MRVYVPRNYHILSDTRQLTHHFLEMDEPWKKHLRSNMPHLTETLDPVQMLPYLTSLSPSESQGITCEAKNYGPYRASTMLIDAVRRHTYFTYKQFIRGLLKHDEILAWEFDNETCTVVEREMEREMAGKMNTRNNKDPVNPSGANIYNISSSHVQIGDSNQQNVSGELRDVQPEIRRTNSSSCQTNTSSLNATPVEESNRRFLNYTPDQNKTLPNDANRSETRSTIPPINGTGANGREQKIPVEHDEKTERNSVTTNNLIGFVDTGDSSCNGSETDHQEVHNDDERGPDDDENTELKQSTTSNVIISESVGCNESDTDCGRLVSNDDSVELPIPMCSVPTVTSVNFGLTEHYASPANNFNVGSTETTDATSTEGNCSSSCSKLSSELSASNQYFVVQYFHQCQSYFQISTVAPTVPS